MSHYTTVKTCFRSLEDLVDALQDMGWNEQQIEVSDSNSLDLIGYQGKPRYHEDGKKMCGIVRVNRKHVGRSSNDIGFIKDADGNINAIISEFDSSKYNTKWVGLLKQNYATRVASKQLKRKGYKVNVQRDGKVIRISASKR